jgi:hypothetical protein
VTVDANHARAWAFPARGDGDRLPRAPDAALRFHPRTLLPPTRRFARPYLQKIVPVIPVQGRLRFLSQHCDAMLLTMVFFVLKSPWVGGRRERVNGEYRF